MVDSIVEIRATPVMYIAGNSSAPVAEQVPAAIGQVEAKLSTLRGRRCYGTVVDGEYRACATILPGDDPASLGSVCGSFPAADMYAGG